MLLPTRAPAPDVPAATAVPGREEDGWVAPQCAPSTAASVVETTHIARPGHRDTPADYPKPPCQKSIAGHRSRPYDFFMAAQAGTARTQGESVETVETAGPRAVELRVPIPAEGVRVAPGACRPRHRSLQWPPPDRRRRHRRWPGRRRPRGGRPGRGRRDQPRPGLDRARLGHRPARVRHDGGRAGRRRAARRRGSARGRAARARDDDRHGSVRRRGLADGGGAARPRGAPAAAPPGRAAGYAGADRDRVRARRAGARRSRGDLGRPAACAAVQPAVRVLAHRPRRTGDARARAQRRKRRDRRRDAGRRPSTSTAR